MARIHYWTTGPQTGRVYGVSKDEDVVTLPSGVASMTVVGAPDKIIWPTVDGAVGKEEWSQVNLTTRALEARTGLDIVPDGVAFMRTIHLNLAGVSVVAKWDRGMTLRKLSPYVRDLIHNTAHSQLTAGRRSIAKVIWGWIKADPVIGLTGTDLVNRLTQAEVTAIEADAASKGVTLT